MKLSCAFTMFLVVMASCQVSQEKELFEIDEPNYLIVYNVLVDGDSDNYDVFVMDLDGGNKKNITNHPDVAWTYLAGKNKVYFISDRDTCSRCFFVYSMNPEGGEIKKYYDLQLRDSWMDTNLDESLLVLNPHRSVDSAFHIVDSTGTLINRVETGLPFASDPQLSPDGSQIAFRGGEASSKREDNFNEGIYLINIDGSGLKRLTHYPADDTTAQWFSYKAGPPKWHPTENFISYQSFQHGKYSLFGVNPGTGESWKLTDNPQDEGWHDWSPDGKFLVIELFDTEQTQFHVGLMDWETKQMKVLTDTTYKYQQSPVFISLD